MNNNVIVVVGPTASGKSSLAVEIAKELDGEIVSCDSMQIYKQMDIATAKPTEEEMQGIPHHLIDFLSPDESFSVAVFKSMAEQIIDDILQREKIPIICGGTGLYVDSILNNTEFISYDHNEIRQKLTERLEKEGMESIFEELKKLDPQSADKLHLSDTKRILRALEVYYLTGRTKTQQDEESHTVKSKYNFCIIFLNAENRQVLYDRINRRVDIMLEKGLLDEAKEFFSSDISSTAKQAIGYKELKPYLDGEKSLDECVENLKKETRHYAKRQLTWFRRYENANLINIDTEKDIKQQALNIIQKCFI